MRPDNAFKHVLKQDSLEDILCCTIKGLRSSWQAKDMVSPEALPTPQFLGNVTELNSGTYSKFQHNAREWDTTSCRGDAGEAESMLSICCTYAVPKPQTTPTHCSQVLQGDGEGNNHTGVVLNAHLHLVLHSTEV